MKKIEYLGHDAETYPFSLPFLNQINQIEFDANINFIIGGNGVGKSTLLETIAILYGLHPEGGSRNNIYATMESENELSHHMRLIRYPSHPQDMYFYRAESFYNLSTDLDEIGVSADLFEKKLHHFSRGESVKALMQHRFFGNGLYLLDEPESGLSLESLLEVLVLMNDLEKKNAQFIIVTHSPILLMYPHANVFQLSMEKGIEKICYSEAEMYQKWKMIFEREENFMQKLFQDVGDE